MHTRNGDVGGLRRRSWRCPKQVQILGSHVVCAASASAATAAASGDEGQRLHVVADVRRAAAAGVAAVGALGGGRVVAPQNACEKKLGLVVLEYN